MTGSIIGSDIRLPREWNGGFRPRQVNRFERLIELNWEQSDGVATVKHIATSWIKHCPGAANLGSKRIRQVIERAHAEIDRYAERNLSPCAVADELNELIERGLAA